MQTGEQMKENIVECREFAQVEKPSIFYWSSLDLRTWFDLDLLLILQQCEIKPISSLS